MVFDETFVLLIIKTLMAVERNQILLPVIQVYATKV